MKTILLMSLGIIFCSMSSGAFAQEPIFGIWPTKSIVSYLDYPTIEFTINPIPSGPFEGFYLEDIDERVPENQILVVYSITYPDGSKENNIRHFHKEDIVQSTTKASFSTPLKGEYVISAQVMWKTNSEFVSYKSNTVTVTAKEPIYRGITDKIPINKIWDGLIPMDWSSNNLILFRYTEQVNEDKWAQNLATIRHDGSDLTELPIPDLTEDQQIFDVQFSPDGKSIYLIMDDRNLYRFDLEQMQITQLTSAKEVYDFDYYHYHEEDPTIYSIIVSVENKKSKNSENYTLLDIGNGEDQNSILNAHALVYDFESSSFDFSPDGKKILFKRILDSSFPPNRVLAYQPAQGDIVEVPSQNTNCGSEPKWAPNGEMIIHISSGCSRGPPGGTIHLTTVDGQYHEILLPYTNDNPQNFAFSPDGTYMVYAIDQNLGIMTLAKPIPEFGTIAIMILLVSILSTVIVFKSGKFQLFS